MTTIHELLNEFADAARSKRDKGDLFERLIANYLLADPQYSAVLSEVWLWGEFPYRWGNDDGIDIVAREKSRDYWAIQCKFFDETHLVSEKDINSFLAALGKMELSNLV